MTATFVLDPWASAYGTVTMYLRLLSVHTVMRRSIDRSAVFAAYSLPDRRLKTITVFAGSTIGGSARCRPPHRVFCPHRQLLPGGGYLSTFLLHT